MAHRGHLMNPTFTIWANYGLMISNPKMIIQSHLYTLHSLKILLINNYIFSVISSKHLSFGRVHVIYVKTSMSKNSFTSLSFLFFVNLFISMLLNYMHVMILYDAHAPWTGFRTTSLHKYSILWYVLNNYNSPQTCQW